MVERTIGYAEGSWIPNLFALNHKIMDMTKYFLCFCANEATKTCDRETKLTGLQGHVLLVINWRGIKHLLIFVSTALDQNNQD